MNKWLPGDHKIQNNKLNTLNLNRHDMIHKIIFKTIQYSD